jgi:hypothetical protein
MTFGRLLVSCAELCVCKYHFWLKWSNYSFPYFIWQLSLSLQYTAALVAISWLGSVNTISDQSGNDSGLLYDTLWLCLMNFPISVLFSYLCIIFLSLYYFLIYVLFSYLCIMRTVCVWMCDVLLPPGVNPTAVKYISYILREILSVFLHSSEAYSSLH